MMLVHLVQDDPSRGPGQLGKKETVNKWADSPRVGERTKRQLVRILKIEATETKGY